MIKARRHIDFFRPGDEIPEGYYDPATLTRLIEKGQVEVVDMPPEPVTEPEPVETPAPTRMVKRSKSKQRL